MDSSTKTIVITGGARGIGREVAWSYRRRGYNIVIGDILDQLGQKVVDDMNQKQVARPSEKKVAVYKHTDVSYYHDNVTLFKTASAEFGKIDIVFLNAGIGSTCNTLFAPLDDERESAIFNVDLVGVIKGTKVALLEMARNQTDSSIIINASTCGFQTPPAMNAYNAAKHGVIGWVRSLDFLPKVDTDLLAHFGDRNTEPYWKVADALPRASLHTLIQAVDTCVTDTLKSGQSEQKKKPKQIAEGRVDLGATLLVLPDGVHDFPRPPVFESAVNEATNAALKEYEISMVNRYKEELMLALQRYDAALWQQEWMNNWCTHFSKVDSVAITMLNITTRLPTPHCPLLLSPVASSPFLHSVAHTLD
ncbi:hypothetical protein [Absidia glauca]|uniref:Uncharacterized protein n=1 Tax=Absidia glauca TaxID=4829 RepID=A0A168N1E4_ABSGL|nr:hypothetical protein [Absidia glauca]